MPNRLAIIPARGGSKRIPQKNIREFCGTSMILRVINTIASSKLFTEIHVSTDDDSTYDLVSKHGYQPKFRRPIELADDNTPLSLVTAYVVNAYNKENKCGFDEVWVILPCSPFITIQDLREISSLLMMFQDPVMTMAKYNAPSQWAHRIDEDGYLQALDTNALKLRSQDLPETLYETGNIIAYPSDLAGRTEGLCYRPYILPKIRAIDIDDEEDWKAAEAFFNCFFLK